jgi:hypothetical protein
VVTRGHSWSLVVTRGHSWSLVVTRGHSRVLLDKTRTEGGWKFHELGKFPATEVRPIRDSPANLQVCLVFITCHFGKKYCNDLFIFIYVMIYLKSYTQDAVTPAIIRAGGSCIKCTTYYITINTYVYYKY